MLEIVNVKEYSEGIEQAVKYIHGVWGKADNYMYYYDAIVHSSNSEKSIPRFYLLLRDGEIIGCYGLVTNDFISRHDLYPWFACLYIEEQERGNNLGELLMEHAEKEAKKSGFSAIYLTTDHDGYYEKFGWKRIEDGYELNDKKTRIYDKRL